MNESLAIPGRTKPMPFRLQPALERRKVVDLTVEDRPDAAVLIGEGLMSTGHVDDREPPKSQRGMVVEVLTQVVRPAVENLVRHRPEKARADTVAPVRPDRTTNPAHAAPPCPLAARRIDAALETIVACRMRLGLCSLRYSDPARNRYLRPKVRNFIRVLLTYGFYPDIMDWR
jgi:hypothetical protein